MRWAALGTLLGAGLAALIVARVALGWDGLKVESGCQQRPFTCGMGTGLAVTIIAVAAGFMFWALVRKRRIVGLYRKRIRDLPRWWRRVRARLRPRGSWALREARMVPRKDLFDLVVEDLRVGRARPQLIVGAIGTGKTFAMDGLGRRLAATRRFVPVQVELAAGEDIDFLALAQARFEREVESHLLRPDEVFVIWQRLRREGKLVVLVDGLAPPPGAGGGWEQVIRRAMCRAEGGDYGLVVASRYEDVPVGLNVAVFELGPLDADEATEFVLARATRDGGRAASHRRRPKDDRRVVEAVLDAAEINETPFYLDFIADLHANGRLAGMDTTSRGRFGLRLDLLDAYMRALGEGAAARDTALLGESRTKLIGALEKVAHARVAGGNADLPVGVVPDTRRGAEDARRLQLTEPNGAGVRFRHAILEGYLAARDIVEAPDPVAACAALLGSDASPPAAGRNRGSGVAVAIAGGLLARSSQRDARSVAESIVATARDRTDGTSFPLVTAAADIATVLSGEEKARVVHAVADFVENRPDEKLIHDPPVERARLAARLQTLGGTRAAGALWALATGAAYEVRLPAARRLAELGDAAVEVLEPMLGAVPDRDADPAAMTPDEVLVRSVECWMLPTLAESARARREWVDERLARWLDRRWEDSHPSIEASLAQGYKFAATRSATPLDAPPPAARQAASLLGRVEFWYSQVSLIQALTVWNARAGQVDGDAKHILRDHRKAGHPYVRRTARLCLRALRRGSLPRYVWADEAAVSRRATSGPWPRSPVAEGWRALGRRAARLMADILLALNLTEGDGRNAIGPAGRLARMRGACVDALPRCLTARDGLDLLRVTGTRATESSACSHRCGQGLCPYPARARPTYRGEVTEAFCRHQASLRYGRARRLWLEMEARVQA
jgi:hypothetical protein